MTTKEAKPAKPVRVKWACPKCGAGPNKHGRGKNNVCDRDGQCQGFICDCDPLIDRNHGLTFADPCPQANCYHCGWGGTFPEKPKGAQPWEKKALKEGWAPPAKRAKELGL